MQQAWEKAVLEKCPLHPEAGCGFTRHGTYCRTTPPGSKIARWYCPTGQMTFSMLPDCFCARLSGTLIEVEAVIGEVEKSVSQEAAADNLRLDIDLPGALRWIRRRLSAFELALIMLIDLLEGLPKNIRPTLESFRVALNVEHVLPQLRRTAAFYLPVLPSPLGFAPYRGSKGAKSYFQHKTGTDPP